MNPAKSGYTNESRYERLHGKTAKSGPLRAVTETDHDKSTLVQTDHLLQHAMRRWQSLDFFIFYLWHDKHTSRDVNDFVGNIKGRVTAEVTV